MDNNQFLDLIDTYVQGNKDIHALRSDYAARLAAGKTPLGLNQWVKSDKPIMEDFNEDNRIIDEKLGELQDKKADRETLQEFPLKLEPGIVQRQAAKCTYSKDAFGRVHILFSVETSPLDNTLNGKTIATLPAGFRPDARVLSSCTCIDSEFVSMYPGALSVLPNGDVLIQFNGARMAGAYGNVLFIAAQ